MLLVAFLLLPFVSGSYDEPQEPSGPPSRGDGHYGGIPEYCKQFIQPTSPYRPSPRPYTRYTLKPLPPVVRPQPTPGPYRPPPTPYRPPPTNPTRPPSVGYTPKPAPPATPAPRPTTRPPAPPAYTPPTPGPDGIGVGAPSNPAYENCIKNNPKVFCDQIIWWDGNSRQQPAVLLSPPGFVAFSPFAASLQQSDVATLATDRSQCRDIQCICQFAQGSYRNNQCTLPQNRGTYGKVTRKEFRMMTDDERNRFRNAMWGIRTTQYLALSKIHASYVSSPAAHSGPAFLPWHREFIKRLEIALRQYDPTVALPYWDSTLDTGLDDPKASVMWSPELMGAPNSAGVLDSGMFAYWQAHLDHTTLRELGKSPRSAPTTQYSLTMIMSTLNRTSDVLAFSAASPDCPRSVIAPPFAVEFVHGANHVWIGGDMLVTTRATNDPLFFLHHCMIDNIWETWRLAKQSRAQRETDYPTDNIKCSSQSHFARSIMVPFSPLVNADGLSNMYTDNLYTYAPRPTCSRTNRDCGSRYLFCHGTTFVCVSRIRAPFPCDPSRYGGVDPCYGRCSNRVCIAPPQSAPALSASAPQLDPFHAAVIPDETCFNQNPCCADWASKGGCERDKVRMGLVCAASCKVCTPQKQLNDDCEDRHPLCGTFDKEGKCSSNANFMAENCRKTCGLCGKDRNSGCLAFLL